MYSIKLKLLCTAIISVIFFSCSKNRIHFKKDLQFFEESGWKDMSSYDFKINERGTYRSGTDINIFLRAVNKDTTISLEYSKRKEGVYFPNLYYKVYKTKKINDSLSYYRLISFKKSDTLYDYTILSKKDYYFNFDEMVFNSGKYYFMNTNRKLKGNQYSYYEKHKDSLDKIRGNELPKLPQ